MADDFIEQALSYNPATGVVLWLLGQRAGRVAGSYDKDGYLVIQFQGKIYKAHHVAWRLHYGVWPTSEMVDHRNGVRDANWIDNLREATRQQNANNVAHRGSGGVKKHSSGKYEARTQFKGKYFYLGVYSSEDEAREVVAAKRQALCAEFARV